MKVSKSGARLTQVQLSLELPTAQEGCGDISGVASPAIVEVRGKDLQKKQDSLPRDRWGMRGSPSMRSGSL